jgi:hypothetical protein
MCVTLLFSANEIDIQGVLGGTVYILGGGGSMDCSE